MEGTPFGRYVLLDLLGRGGMGEVWRAHDVATNRTVAIKVLPAHLATDEMFVQRFRREAEAAARVNSPHVIPIYDYGEIDSRLYVAMRLIEGRDLQAVLTEGPLPPSRADPGPAQPGSGGGQAHDGRGPPLCRVGTRATTGSRSPAGGSAGGSRRPCHGRWTG